MLNAIRDRVSPREVITFFYGWNTLGGACGALITGFFLIWILGIRLTLLLAIALNACIGAATLLIARRMALNIKPQQAEEALSPQEDGKTEALWLTLAFINGFAVLGYEILWGRMAKFLLGDRTLAISMLLFIFITGLGLGSFFVTRLTAELKIENKGMVLRLICWLSLMASVLHLLLVPLARFTIQGRGLSIFFGSRTSVILSLLSGMVLIMPPIVLLGIIFPLLVWSARKIHQFPGKVLGNLYFRKYAGRSYRSTFCRLCAQPLCGNPYRISYNHRAYHCHRNCSLSIYRGA
jgi:hypothetical protein